ncbi:MAG: hypothetical protein ACLUKN_06890 [Bacilli bacterium]
MYNIGKIGLIHYVREENSANWHLFREFLSGKTLAKPSPVDDAKKTSLYLQYFAYLLCGRGILSPYIYLCALALCAYLFFACNKRFALEIFGVSTVIAVSGIFFFYGVVPVLMR